MTDQASSVRVLVVGLGTMGESHALAYHTNPGFEIVGLVNRSGRAPSALLSNYPLFTDFEKALSAVEPDLVAIATYPDTHASYAISAMEAGAHVFLEKPIATTVRDANRVVEAAERHSRKLVVGYILRHHPSWMRLIDEARALGGPYVFRLNLNQQSFAETWEAHKNLMRSLSPIVDCGVHYVDVMCQITDAKPVSVRGMGVRLSQEIAVDMYNYGHFQVVFDDGSVGWYEAGWGPMMSETAHFVKDIVSPNGAVSIVPDPAADSQSIDNHTKASHIQLHRAALDKDGDFAKADHVITMESEPGHQGLCDRQQAFMLKAIKDDLDLSRHMRDAVQSLEICLAADESIRMGHEVILGKGAVRPTSPA